VLERSASYWKPSTPCGSILHPVGDGPRFANADYLPDSSGPTGNSTIFGAGFRALLSGGDPDAPVTSGLGSTLTGPRSCSNPIGANWVRHPESTNGDCHAASKKGRHSGQQSSRPGQEGRGSAKEEPFDEVGAARHTMKQIADELAESHDLPKKQAEAVLSDLVTLTTRHLENGDKIRLTGLGILQVRARPARMSRNPATGEAIKIKTSKKIAFRPAK
jgi:DNA-binding protein HU-beta